MEKRLTDIIHSEWIRFDRNRKNIQDVLNAWIFADHPTIPTTHRLTDLYEYILLDSHLTAAIENNRKLPTLSRPFVVTDQNREVNEDKTKLLKQEWFYDLIGYLLDSLFKGYTLAELKVEDGQVVGIEDVERRCILPQKKLVLPVPTSVVGQTWDVPELRDYYIFRYKPRKWGLLLNTSVDVIYKRYAKAAWVEHAETFALPFLHAKTDTSDANKYAHIQQALQKAGRGRMAITDYGDEITATSLSNGDAYQIYKALADQCDAETSKLILGQTMTMDNGSSRAQAEVHQDILTLILQSDATMIENIVNNDLLPKLIRFGYPLQSCTFAYQWSRELSISEKVSVYTMLLQHYDIPETEIAEKFGVEVFKKVQAQQTQPDPIP